MHSGKAFEVGRLVTFETWFGWFHIYIKWFLMSLFTMQCGRMYSIWSKHSCVIFGFLDRGNFFPPISQPCTVWLVFPSRHRNASTYRTRSAKKLPPECVVDKLDWSAQIPGLKPMRQLDELESRLQSRFHHPSLGGWLYTEEEDFQSCVLEKKLELFEINSTK